MFYEYTWKIRIYTRFDDKSRGLAKNEMNLRIEYGVVKRGATP